MSRASAWLLPLLLAGPIVAPAQESIDSLQRRIASLDTAIVVQRMKLDAATRAVERHIAFTDSLVVGPLHARTTRELRPAVETALREAWTRLAPLATDTLVKRLARRLYHFYVDTMQWRPPRRDVVARVDDMADAWGAGRALTSSRPPSDVALPFLLADADLEARQLFSPRQRQRLGWDEVMLLPPPEAAWASMYRGLATSSSNVARRCAAGDLAMCRVAFGDNVSPGERLSRWYKPEDYPALIIQVGTPRAELTSPGDDSTRVVQREACLFRRDSVACDAIVRALSADAIPQPLPAFARSLIVNEVLRRGGSRALSLLASDSVSDAPVLYAQAAGAPFDSVLASWQRNFLQARPAEVPVQSATVSAVIAATAALLLIAAYGRIR